MNNDRYNFESVWKLHILGKMENKKEKNINSVGYVVTLLQYKKWFTVTKCFKFEMALEYQLSNELDLWSLI